MNENKKPFGYGLAEYTQNLIETERANKLLTENPAGAGDGQSFGGDVVDATQYGLAQAVGGLAETGHQLTGVEALADVRDTATDWGKSQLEEMSPEGREAMAAQIFTESEPDFEGNTSLQLGDGATNWKTWALQLSSLAGQMAPQIALGGGFASLGAKVAGKVVMKTAAKRAAANGATREAAELAGKQAAEATFAAARGKAGVASFALVGSAIAGGMIGNEVRDEVLEMTDDQLDQSNEYRKLYYQIQDMQPQMGVKDVRDLTKRTLADRTAETVQADPMLITSNLAMEAIGGKFLDNLVRGIGTGGRLSNGAQQFAVQGTTEAAQGGIEKYASNSAIIEEGVDPNRDAFEGVKVAAANEGALGGVLGGGMGMVRSGQPASDTQLEIDQVPVEETEQQPINAEQYSEDGEQQMVPITQDPLVAAELGKASEAQSESSPGETVTGMNPERGKYRGIDDDILIAEKQGFAEEAVRLRTAKRNFEMAQDFLDEGDQESANRFRERGLKIYRDVMEPNSPDNHESSDLFPAEYVATGEVLQKESMPVTATQQSGETIEAERQADISHKVESPAQRLEHEDIVYAGHDQQNINAAKAKTDQAMTEQQGEMPGTLNTPQPHVNEALVIESDSDSSIQDGSQTEGQTKPEPSKSVTSDEEVSIKASEAALSKDNDLPEPTEAQKQAGNYKKAHIAIQGLDIAIENPRESQRSGTDPDGNKWSVKMAHHYGYLKRTEGADGDHVDVFIGKYPESEKVFIVDQINADGKFDEHKVMLGFKNKAMAITGYKASYEKGWKVGPIKSMPMAEFKEWLKSGDTKNPAATENRSEASISEEFSLIVNAANKRKNDAGKKSGKFSSDLEGSDLDFLTNSEKSRLHELKQMLPSTGSEALSAKARNKERAQARKNRSKNKADNKEPVKQLSDTDAERLVELIQQDRNLKGFRQGKMIQDVRKAKEGNPVSYERAMVNLKEMDDAVSAKQKAETEEKSLVKVKRQDKKKAADEKTARIYSGNYEGLQDQYKEWLGTLSDKKRKELFEEKSKPAVRAAVYMEWIGEQKPSSKEAGDNKKLTESGSPVSLFRESDKPDKNNEVADAIKDMKETLQRTEDSDKKEPATESAFSSVDDVKDWIAETEKFLGKKVNVVASKMDLPIAVKFRVGIANFGKDFDAIYDQETGGTWINANQILDKEHAVKTVLHETLGHGGVIDFLHEQASNGGLEVTDALENIYRRAGRKLINRDIERYGFDYSKPKQRQTAVLEYIAHLAETGKKAHWMHKVIGAIKNAMRKIFPNIPWTDLDTLVLLEKGRRHLRENGNDGHGADEGASALMRLSDAIENDSNLTDEQKAFLDKIGPKSLKQTVVDRASEVMNRWRLKTRQGMVDRFAALLEMDKKLLGDNATSNENITSSSWVRARMSNGASGAVSAMMSAGRVYLDAAEGVVDVKANTHGLVHALNKLGDAAEVEKFFGWIAANRAEKLANEGRENLFTAEDIAAGKKLNQGSLHDGRDRSEVYDQVFVEFQQHRDDVLAIAEKAGIITAENREMWANEFYVPFYRVMEGDDSVQGAKTMAGLSRQQAYKKLKGGSQNVNDLLQNTIMNFHHLVDASLKNLAAAQAIDNALEIDVVSVTPEATKSKQATYVLRDGQKVWYDVHDDLVFQSLTALNSTGMNNTMMKAMRWFKRTFTNMTTSTPQFLVANLLRDSLSSIAVADLKANPVGNVASGIKSFGLLDKSKYERARLLATGGAFSFGHIYGEDADSIRYYIDGEMRRANIVKDPAGLLKAGIKPVQAAWDKWQDVSNGFENANRMAAFQQAEAAGKGKLYAAHQSRDMMDFSGIGAWPAVRFLVDVVPFLNARLQGLDKLYRAGVKPTSKVVMNALGVGDVNASVSEKKAAARFMSVLGALSMATMALYLRNKDDEEYQKLEDWHKDSYWWFRIPGTDHVITIPKPFEVGAIATLTERLLEQAVDDKATGKLFTDRLGHMLGSTFAFSPIPQMLQPTLDVYANKDSFTGRQIETMGQQRLSPSQRTTDRTTAAAELLGNGMEAVLGADSTYTLSPIQIDYLIGGYFGQVGAWAVGQADVLRNTLSDNERPARHWYEYQPIRRFYKNLEDPHHDKQQTLFYESLRNSSRIYADLKQMRVDRDVEGANKLKSDNKELLSIRKRLNRTSRQLTKINSRIKRIKADSSLSADEKRKEIDLLRVRKNLLIDKSKQLTDALPS